MTERRIFRRLVNLSEALRVIETHARLEPLGTEAVRIEEALGAVLAQDITASLDVPAFDRATMDGFALRAADTFAAREDAPRRLRLCGRLEPGRLPRRTVRRGEAVEIATGAVLPRGSNAVVMVERTRSKGGVVEVFHAVSPGENVMAAGSDIMRGELVLRKGTIITPREVGVLAAIGLRTVNVFVKPRVAVLSTGNELAASGTRLRAGQIYDVNAPALNVAIRESGGTPIPLGITPDSTPKLRRILVRALQRSDIVITSGSTSAGAGDRIYRLLDELGEPGVLVHGLAFKPGKPTVVALADGKLIFGLPGYPTSALMVYHVLVDPIIRRLAGGSPGADEEVLSARMATRVFSEKGRLELLPVQVLGDAQGVYRAYPIFGGSGAVTSFALADGFIEVSAATSIVEQDSPVQVKLFGKQLRIPDLVIVGSHCVGVDVLYRLVRQKRPNFVAKIVNVGSAGGLRAIGRGEGDVAGTHLFDGHSGTYNIPFLARYRVAEYVRLIRGYVREQGLVVARGNPKRIQRLTDLFRRDIVFINRNPGSGTRMLLEWHLSRLAAQRNLELADVAARIRGFDVEAKSHTAVASAIHQRRADVGLAIRTVAEQYRLSFLPLAEERYDFAIRTDRMSNPGVIAFLDALRSTHFRELLEQEAPGLRATEETGRVLEIGLPVATRQ